MPVERFSSAVSDTVFKTAGRIPGMNSVLAGKESLSPQLANLVNMTFIYKSFGWAVALQVLQKVNLEEIQLGLIGNMKGLKDL